jgi:hypothetical protein
LAVAALAIFAASPDLHAWLHGHAEHAGNAHAAHGTTCPHGHPTPASTPVAPADHNDALCIITQFAHGASELVGAPALLPAPPLARTGDTLPLSVFCAPGAPAYLLPPGCGPPLV